MAADVTITEFTDPACPFAFSAEPFRWKLDWLYGDKIAWDVKLVGLSDDPGALAAKGFTPEMLANGMKRIAEEHHMPIDTRPPERMAASVPACLAVVAARLHAPEQMRALLRALRVRTFSGAILDAQETIDGAARDAGIDPAALAGWMAGEDVRAALDEDMAAAREPSAAALALDARLADWSGGRRYTCPSYEMERVADGLELSAPGFQPWRVYDVISANLMPGVARRAVPETVAEVLAWAGTPLASEEVAVICEVSLAEAREQLSLVAVEQPVGAEGYWTLAA
ncbi:MAG TPA: DsbA family protein [Baekduia sp.]|jgi:predicted DsbA family dithiol-disulfide isomerase